MCCQLMHENGSACLQHMTLQLVMLFMLWKQKAQGSCCEGCGSTDTLNKQVDLCNNTVQFDYSAKVVRRLQNE